VVLNLSIFLRFKNVLVITFSLLVLYLGSCQSILFCSRVHFIDAYCMVCMNQYDDDDDDIDEMSLKFVQE